MALPSGFLRKKTAPGIPGTMLEEPYLCQEPACLMPEILETVAVAVTKDLQRAGIIQTDHANEAFGVDQLHIVAYHDLKGLNGSNADKFLYFLKRVDRDVKFLHKLPPNAIQS